MCGIAGVMWFEQSLAQTAIDAAGRMQEALRHRGPDGAGIWTSPSESPRGVSLAHTRLAIIDLSDAAGQPMQRGGPVLVHNGEIYNFRQVRSELAARGAAFTTSSDTEVLLRAWEAWGSGFVERLEGMFAVGLWDPAAARLWLARDRFGIKPLYYAEREGLFAFASEIGALLASRVAAPCLDRRLLDHYLRFQTAPTPATLVSGVSMLEPASLMSVDGPGSRAPRRYWHLLSAAGREAGNDRREVTLRVRTLLEHSARAHLVADVPVGVFLSGGIDSGALLSVLSSVGVRPQTFSLAFPGTPYDESRFARSVAERFGSEHTEVPVTEERLLELVPEALGSLDHPSGDGINTFVVSRLAREHGVKVAWSGLGGDELFGGYPSFQRLARVGSAFEGWGRLPRAVRAATAGLIRRGAPAAVAADKLADAVATEGGFSELWPLTRQLYGSRERARLLGFSPTGSTACEALLAEGHAACPGATPWALTTFAETRIYMHDVLLRDADQMSMAHGLEVRVPLLDRALAEYLIGLPDGLRAGGATPKGLLVDSLARPLPAEVVNRPKQGFTFPFDPWMRGRLKPFVESRLGNLEERGVFQAGQVGRLWREFLHGSRTVTWARVWILVALDAWLDRYGIEVGP